jgi:SAM-dependent methyltransferase
MHANSLKLFQLHGLPLIRNGDRVLEVGPDWLIPGGRVRPMIEAVGAEYHFADVVNPPGGLRMADDNSFECEDGRFDVVVSLNVAEHVRRIWTWLREVARITKPGGLIISVNPVSWPYHTASYNPFDCWRILPDGWNVLFEEVGLEPILARLGTVSLLEPGLRVEHGYGDVVDAIAIGRKPQPGTS